MKEEINLMDEVHRFTYTGFKHIPTNSAQRQILLKYRQELRKAHKFVLDENAARLAAELSHQKSKMPLWAILARLPYNNIWIEYDPIIMLKVFEKMGTLKDPIIPEEVSKKCGYLMVREGETRWWATEFVFGEGKHEIFPQPTCFLFDPDGTDLHPVGNTTYWNIDSVGNEIGMVDVNVVSDEETMKATISPAALFFGLVEYNKGKANPQFVDNKADAFIEPLWRNMREDPKDKWFERPVNIDIRERSGVLRRLITILAMINEVPESIIAVRSRPGTMQAGRNMIEYFSYSSVTVKVPKRRNVVKFYNKQLDKSAHILHKRAHNVRGHWRIIERNTGKSRTCKHIPASEAINGIVMCAKCKMKIRWVKEHVRGDSTLGWVFQEYNVTQK